MRTDSTKEQFVSQARVWPCSPRAATLADGPELVRLAELTYAEIGFPWRDTAWKSVALAELSGRLGRDLNAFVVDDPDDPDHLAACGAATLNHRLPSPTNPMGAVGYIQWVGTVARCRRRGYAQAVMQALIGWLAEVGFTRVELHTSPAAADLYRKLGFEVAAGACLRLDASRAGQPG